MRRRDYPPEDRAPSKWPEGWYRLVEFILLPAFAIGLALVTIAYLLTILVPVQP